MTRTLPLLAVLAVLTVMLAACNAERPADNAQAPAASPVADQPAQDTPPATTPPPAAPASGLAHFDGYGDMRFGMTADEAKKAWAGELNGKPGKDEICYYLNPVSTPSPAYFAFMIESDKFVRYDVGNDKEIAPGGGKRGMSADDIRELYSSRIQVQPHKYVEGGKVLRIKANDGSGGVLIFETDATGKVTAWRVGQPPQVDYVEGCS
ncbi:MAG TPA: lectin [Luteimonas sp.]|nr:lectin [Luteimonas sp.]